MDQILNYFEDAPDAVLLNGDSVKTIKCKLCSIRILKPNRTRLIGHRKSCPFPLHFEYVYPTRLHESLKMRCLVCFGTVTSTSISVLNLHRNNCKPAEPEPEEESEPDICFVSPDEILNTRESIMEMDVPQPESEQVQGNNIGNSNLSLARTNENVQSTGNDISEVSSSKYPDLLTEKIQWDKDAVRFDFKIVRIRDSQGILKRAMQCLICQRILMRAGKQTVLSHRNVCSRSTTRNQQTSQILISTQTTPKIDQSSRKIKNCFICDVEISIINGCSTQTHINLLSETTTNHSKTLIHDFIWKFLADKPPQRNITDDSNWNCICMTCFKNIDALDFVCTEAQRLEKLLTDKLTTTENKYQQMNIDNDEIEIIEENDELLIISDEETDANNENDSELMPSVQNQQYEQQDKEVAVEEVIVLDSDDTSDSTEDPLSTRVLSFNEL